MRNSSEPIDTIELDLPKMAWQNLFWTIFLYDYVLFGKWIRSSSFYFSYHFFELPTLYRYIYRAHYST